MNDFHGSVMRARKQSGFTMIEVLISVLVLALGVIGVAGMQLAALRSNQQSGSQGTAMQIASEIADAMRSNHLEMAKLDAANLFLTTGSYNSKTDALPDDPPKCFNINCSSAQMAEYDIYEWKRKIRDMLPGGRVVVCRDSDPWSAGSLKWGCAIAGGVAAGNVPIVIKLGWQGKGRRADGSELPTGEEAKPIVAVTVESYVK